MAWKSLLQAAYFLHTRVTTDENCHLKYFQCRVIPKTIAMRLFVCEMGGHSHRGEVGSVAEGVTTRLSQRPVNTVSLALRVQDTERCVGG